MRLSSMVAGALCVIGLAACSDSSPNLVSTSVSPAVGTYALKSVDGALLPWTNPDHPEDTLISQAFNFHADGTWDDAVAYSNGFNGSDNGTYTVSGDSLTLTLGGKPYKASLSGGTLTLLFGGHVGVFQKF